MGADWQTELPLFLSRAFSVADNGGAPAVVRAYAPELPKMDFLDATGISLQVLAPRALAGFAPDSDSEYAMALTGVA